MPLYEYRCERCGKTFMIVATIAEYSRGIAVSCPKCQSPEATRIIGRPAILGTTPKSGVEDSSEGDYGNEGFDDEGADSGVDFDDEE